MSAQSQRGNREECAKNGQRTGMRRFHHHLLLRVAFGSMFSALSISTPLNHFQLGFIHLKTTYHGMLHMATAR